MRNLKLFFAAVALFGASVSMLRAESIMALNTGDVTLPSARSLPVAAQSGSIAPASSTAVPPAVEASPAVEVAARGNVQDRLQEDAANPARAADRPAVMAARPAAHRVRMRASCAHRQARLHKRAAQVKIAPHRAPVWLAAPSAPQCGHCWQLVLLGVGY